MRQVVFAPEVADDLVELISILVQKDYLSNYELAESYVQDIISYTETVIETYPSKPAPIQFARYGIGLKYLPYKRNQRTTWYIMFETHDDCYFVTFITNSHVSGQFFNQET